MRIHVWGTDFRRGSPELRRRLFVPAENRKERISELLKVGFNDLIYLATCNRIEFYTTANDAFTDTRPQWHALLEQFGFSEEAYYEGYHLEGKGAVRHLMRVASSLESMVVGEPQILGQLKEALRWSKENGIPVEPELEKLFQISFEAAKKTRSETSVGEKPISVATLGIQRAQATESRHAMKSAVVVGRGPISLAIIDWILKNRPECHITWVNRSAERLQQYQQADRVGIMSLSDFTENPVPFTHFFSATASPVPLFDANFFSKLDTNPKQVFDFAHPGDIAESVLRAPYVELVKLDDLRKEAEANRHAREKAVKQADLILEEALRSYCLSHKEAPVLKEFSSVEPKILDEIEAAMVLMPGLPVEIEAKVKRWGEQLVKKSIHHSREHLRTVLRKVAEPPKGGGGTPVF